jgi:hypothetical protein
MQEYVNGSIALLSHVPSGGKNRIDICALLCGQLSTMVLE